MEIFDVTIDKLDVQEPKEYSQMEIDLMVKSIEMAGLLAPLVVRSNVKTGKYIVLDGARRLIALKKLNFNPIPCVYSCCAANVKEALQIVEGNK